MSDPILHLGRIEPEPAHLGLRIPLTDHPKSRLARQEGVALEGERQPRGQVSALSPPLAAPPLALRPDADRSPLCRRPRDHPSARPTHLRVRRFVCRVCHCPRRIFAERLPALAAAFARRTTRLAAHVL